jgi:hypothetical protein
MQKIKPEPVCGRLVIDATKKRMKVRGWIIASQTPPASSARRKASAKIAPVPLGAASVRKPFSRMLPRVMGCTALSTIRNLFYKRHDAALNLGVR